MPTPISLPSQVKLIEVGPRDGLQNEKNFVSTEIKIALIKKLVQAGMRHIECAAFVSPKWVPQMADGTAVMASIQSLREQILVTPNTPSLEYSALVPNMKGFEAAQAAGIKEVVIFTAASETFSRKNINCSIAESITRFREVADAAQSANIKLRGSISCSLGCPYEGEIAPHTVVNVIYQLAELGCHEIDIADTIGIGTPEKVKRLYEVAAQAFPLQQLSGHFHDTYGQALANIYAALQVGVQIFHSSVAGLGGCPYAKGATGNVASEDVVYLLQGLGIETNIDLYQLALTGEFISQKLGRTNNSRTGKALLAKQLHS